MRVSPYSLVSVEDALNIILQSVAPLPAQSMPLAQALGLVLAEDAHANAPQPPFAAATVDGFAVRVVDGRSPRRLIGRQMAGSAAHLGIAAGEAVRITTGAPVPAGADAIVMVEQADEVNDQIYLHDVVALAAGMHIRSVGFDVQPGQTVLTAGAILGPAELGVLASLGLASVVVHRRPVVGVLSTGDELAPAGQPLQPGQIYDSNRVALLAAVTQAGGVALDLGMARDDPAGLVQRFEQALPRVDVLVASGGVSMGELDLLKPLLAQRGQVHVGRVRMKPGKPMTFATVTHNTARVPVFALPGNPVSAFVTFTLFVRPAIRRLLGHATVSLPRLTATLGHAFTLDPERPEFHRVQLRRMDERFVAISTGVQASSRLLSAAGANGLLLLEQGDGVLPAGTERPVWLFNEDWLAL